MGCVSSDGLGAERKERGSQGASILRTSAANVGLNDCDLARKNAEASDPVVLNKKVQEITKKN